MAESVRLNFKNRNKISYRYNLWAKVGGFEPAGKFESDKLGLKGKSMGAVLRRKWWNACV